MLKKIFHQMQKINFYFYSMNPIPKIFYITLTFLLVNIALYRLILFPKLILLLVLFFISEYLRTKFNIWMVERVSKTKYNMNFIDVLDTTAIFLLFIQTIFNIRFTNIHPAPLVHWTKTIHVNYRTFTSNSFVIFILSFSKTLMSILITALSIFVLKNNYISNLLHIKILQDVFHFLITINIGLIFMNLIPLAPLDMGIMLEHLAPNNIRKFFIASRSYGSLILLIFYYLGFINRYMYFMYTMLRPILDKIM